jgi:hypothetical protein
VENLGTSCLSGVYSYMFICLSLFFAPIWSSEVDFWLGESGIAPPARASDVLKWGPASETLT